MILVGSFGLVTAAQAQTAEATKAAVDAGNVLLQYQVLGAACVFLLLAVGVLFWLLLGSWKDKAALVERVVTTAEQSRVAADDNTEATKALTVAVGALTTAVQTLGREAEGEAREVRHGLANLATIVSASAEAMRNLRDQFGRGQR